MHIKSTLFAISLIGLSTVHADFVVITDKPTPTAPSHDDWQNIGESLIYDVHTSTMRLAAEASYTSSLGRDGLKDLSSANEQISRVVKTATYDIPKAVTDADETITTFTTAPAWYTGLPQDVLSIKEKQASDRYSMDSSLYAEATAYLDGDDKEGEDSAAVRNVVGVGAAAAAVAAMML